MTDPEEAVAAPLRELYELLTDRFGTEVDQREDRPPPEGEGRFV